VSSTDNEEPPAQRLYALVIVSEVLVIAGLWLLERAFA
jgi:hypothetical protein